MGILTYLILIGLLLSQEFLSLFFKLAATQCVNFPTRNQNILDVVLCSSTQSVEYIHASEPVSTSDHSSIVYSMKCHSQNSAEHVIINNYALLKRHKSNVNDVLLGAASPQDT